MHIYKSFILLTFLLTYLLTPRCRVLLEKLTGLKLVKKFPAFHGTPRFVTALTNVRHLSLSWASPIQSIYPHPTSRRSILILSTPLRLGLPSGLLPCGCPTKTLYIPLSSPIRATCPAHLIKSFTLKHQNCSDIRLNKTPTWCNKIQILLLQTFSTCFGRHAPIIRSIKYWHGSHRYR